MSEETNSSEGTSGSEENEDASAGSDDSNVTLNAGVFSPVLTVPAERYDDLIDLEEDMNRIDSAIKEGPYSDDWNSLSGVSCPGWFADAKFGIFVHWGVFTSEEFANEWYPRNMYIEGTAEYRHHIEKYGPHKESGYADYVDRFRPDRFDPYEWMKLFREAGAEYVIPVAEHHDGFQMYKSSASHWNAFEKGPKRDIIAELKEAAKANRLRFGVSSHRIEHWWFLGNGRGFDSDIKGEFRRGDLYWPSNPEPADVHDFSSQPAPSEEFMQDWLSRVCEIVDRFYPEVIYFDWWIGHEALKPYLKKAAAYYYGRMAEKGMEGIIVSKNDAFAPGTSVRDIERGGLAEAASYVWESDTPICRSSWGYVKDASYKSAKEIVHELIDIVSKNGNLLLNVGPKADGSICDEEREVLLGIGNWLSYNGEMIYESRPYKVFGEGKTNRSEGGFKDDEDLKYTSSDFRFTVRGGNIYAAAMEPSPDGRYVIKSLAKNGEDGSMSYKGIISKVTVLGDGSEAAFKHTESGLEIECTYRPDDDMPVVFRIEPA